MAIVFRAVKPLRPGPYCRLERAAGSAASVTRRAGRTNPECDL